MEITNLLELLLRPWTFATMFTPAFFQSADRKEKTWSYI
jgi:hypothetical protein